MAASVSVKDVAAAAGVSVGTVSNVLNRPDRVGAATRTRVESAIERLGFVRNESARHLRAGASRTIGYLVLDAANPFFTDVARGVEEAARDAGLAVFLCNSDNSRQREHEYLELLFEQRVRGVLVTPVNPAGVDASLPPGVGVPVVLVDRTGGEKYCSVSVDDVYGGRLAGQYLRESGHERIAFVGGPESVGQVQDRLAGFQEAVQGAEPSVLPTAALTVAEGRAAGQRLAGMPASRRPTAAFCANDLLALGLLQEMTRLRIRVPEDLAIVGYDDIEFAAAAAVPLTSVRQPRHQIGRTAAELLAEETEAAEGAGRAHRHRQVVYLPELIVRESTIRS